MSEPKSISLLQRTADRTRRSLSTSTGRSPAVRRWSTREKGFVTEQDFREFTFTNAAMLHTRNNPRFFKGTAVAQAVADELGLERPLLAATA